MWQFSFLFRQKLNKVEVRHYIKWYIVINFYFALQTKWADQIELVPLRNNWWHLMRLYCKSSAAVLDTVCFHLLRIQHAAWGVPWLSSWHPPGSWLFRSRDKPKSSCWASPTWELLCWLVACRCRRNSTASRAASKYELYRHSFHSGIFHSVIVFVVPNNPCHHIPPVCTH